MGVLDLKRRYRDGTLPKPAYIDGMYAHHRELFDYPDLLASTDVAEIRLTPEGVGFTTREDGLRFLLRRPDKRVAPVEILNFDRYEPAEREVLLSLAPPDGVALDVGANIGFYALALAKRMPEGVVHAFEPVPAVHDDLRRHVALNGLTNVVTHHLGLGDRAGELTFHYDPDYCTRTSLGDLGDPSLPTVRCPVTRLDDFAAAHALSRLDLIKADVEGAELLVLKGGLATIERFRPAIFLELLRKWSARFGYHPNDVIALLRPLGYRCRAVGEGGLRPLDEVTDATVETNFLFLPEPG